MSSRSVLEQSLEPGQPLHEQPRQTVAVTEPPIDKLPIELLTRCFLCLAQRDPPGFTEDEDGILRFHHGWVVVVPHVCHRWRVIALDTAFLWAIPTWMLGPRWFEEMLARSKAAPLTIRHNVGIHPPSWKDQERLNSVVLDTIASHLSRIRAIYISGIVYPAGRFPILQTLTKRAPALQELDLLKVDSMGNLPLPDDFLGSTPSSIRKLRLSDIGRNWASPVFSELTELVVIYGSRSPSFDELYDMLGRNGRLELLTLHYCLPLSEIDTTPHPVHRRIALPHLKKLSVSDRANSCAQLLMAIESSVDTILDFRASLSSSRFHDRDISTLFSVLSAHTSRPARTFRTLVLLPSGTLNLLGGTVITLGRHDAGMHCNYVDGFDGIKVDDRVSICIEPDPEDGFGDGTDTPSATHIMKLAYDSMPLIDTIDALAVCPFEMEDLPDVWCGLEPMQNIKYLRTSCHEVIRHLHLTFFLPVSGDDATDERAEPDRDPGYLFPNLVHLDLQDVDFIEQNPAGEEELTAMLRGRRMLGSPLLSLTLTRCKVPDGMTERLKDVDGGLKVRLSSKAANPFRPRW